MMHFRAAGAILLFVSGIVAMRSASLLVPRLLARWLEVSVGLELTVVSLIVLIGLSLAFVYKVIDRCFD